MANPSVLNDDGWKTGTVASTSIQPTTAPTAGNMAVVCISQAGASSGETVTDTAGNTWTKGAGAATSSDNVASIWYAQLSSVSGSPYKINLSGMAVVATPWGVNFLECINFDPALIDGTPGASNYASGSSTTISQSVGSAANANDLGILCAVANSAETWTATAPMVEHANSNALTSSGAVFYGTITGAGATTLAATFSVSTKRASAGLLVKAAAAAAAFVPWTWLQSQTNALLVQ